MELQGVLGEAPLVGYIENVSDRVDNKSWIISSLIFT
jgi:hypothetical protein